MRRETAAGLEWGFAWRVAQSAVAQEGLALRSPTSPSRHSLLSQARVCLHHLLYLLSVELRLTLQGQKPPYFKEVLTKGLSRPTHVPPNSSPVKVAHSPVSILQVGKQRHREVKSPPWGHTASKWKNWVNPILCFLRFPEHLPLGNPRPSGSLV